MVYVELTASNPAGEMCSCHLGLTWVVTKVAQVPGYDGAYFWMCPSGPKCTHFPSGVRSFDDRLLKPIRGLKPDMTTDKPEKINVT